MRSARQRVARFLVGGMLLSLPAGAAVLKHGGNGHDRAGAFQTLVIEPDDPAGDVACAFCTVVVRGHVEGDLAALFSTVRVEDGQSVEGDVAGLFSTLRLGDGSMINGDMAWLLGSSSLGEGAQVHGDRMVLGNGVSWMVVIAPLLIVIGVVWLLISLVRRAL